MVHHKTAGLRTGEIINGKTLQPAIFIANRKQKTRRSGQGAWRGVDEISGMRDGWHTIPVKILSQLGLSVSPPCSTNSSMGLSRYKRIRLRLTFWTVCTARTGQFKAVDPQYGQKIRGHKLGSIRVLARPGWTTPDQQWRPNGLRVCNIRLLSWTCSDLRCARRLKPLSNSSNFL